jgi:hypothetical protein
MGSMAQNGVVSLHLQRIEALSRGHNPAMYGWLGPDEHPSPPAVLTSHCSLLDVVSQESAFLISSPLRRWLRCRLAFLHGDPHRSADDQDAANEALDGRRRAPDYTLENKRKHQLAVLEKVSRLEDTGAEESPTIS